MKWFNRRAPVVESERQRFGHFFLDGRRVYLCGFTHGTSLLKPGRKTISATANLFEEETPRVFVEGDARWFARRLKHEKISKGLSIDSYLHRAGAVPEIKRKLDEFFGFDTIKKWNRLWLVSTIAGTVGVAVPYMRRMRDVFYTQQGATCNNESFPSPDELKHVAIEMYHHIGSLADFENAKHRLPRRDYLRWRQEAHDDDFILTFRSFLMADLIRREHEQMNTRVPFAVFTGLAHSPEIGAFLIDNRLSRLYANKLPECFKLLRQKVHELYAADRHSAVNK